jgi:hypothetical protein
MKYLLHGVSIVAILAKSWTSSTERILSEFSQIDVLEED